MFLSLFLLLRKNWQERRFLYQEYLACRGEVLGGILRDAYAVATNGHQRIRLDLDESISQPMTRLAIQLVEQALGSKQVGFNPRVRVAPRGTKQ